MTQEEIRERLLKAKSFFDRGEIAEARDLLEEDLARSPRDSKSLNFLAYLYYRLGELEKARDTYRRLTGLEPENLAVWSNLGLVAYKMGRYEEARIAFEEYLARNPGEPKVLSFMGLVMDRMGRSATARTYQAKAKAEQETVKVSHPVREEAPPEQPAPEESASRIQEPPPEEILSLDGWYRAFEEDGSVQDRICHSHSPTLVSLRIQEKLFFALPSLVTYQGIVIFEQGINPYGRIPREFRSDALILMAAEGDGRLMLTHAGGGLTALGLEGEAIRLNALRLAAFDAALDCEWLPLGRKNFLPGLVALRLSGRGRVVLAAGEGPAFAPVKPGAPLYVHPASVVGWTDALEPAVDKGEDLKQVKSFFDGPFLRFEGSGRVFVS